VIISQILAISTFKTTDRSMGRRRIPAQPEFAIGAG
jgi:hypothetical protein